jgi:L-alanine-DL-glutamate epimerase-like enolase superfamily enzyme
MGLAPVLFEQPVHRDDWEGLRDVSDVAMEKNKVVVAADESYRSLLDAQKIIQGNCWGEGEDATLRSRPSPYSLHQR